MHGKKPLAESVIVFIIQMCWWRSILLGFQAQGQWGQVINDDQDFNIRFQSDRLKNQTKLNQTKPKR